MYRKFRIRSISCGLLSFCIGRFHGFLHSLMGAGDRRGNQFELLLIHSFSLPKLNEINYGEPKKFQNLSEK